MSWRGGPRSGWNRLLHEGGHAAADAARALARVGTWRFAWRNVLRNPRRTGIVLTAVAVGLAGILLTMAINVGMVLQMVDTAIETDLGHLQVHKAGYEEDPGLELRLGTDMEVAPTLAASPAVEDFAPRVRSDGLLFSPRASVGVRVLGVDAEREGGVSVLPDAVVEGAFPDGDPRRVAIGERLARRLEVGLGDKVVLSVQDAAGDLTGEAYRVGGLFRTASQALDQGVVVLTLAESQRLLGIGDDVSEYVVMATDPDAVDRLRDQLARRLGSGAEVHSWKQLQPLLVRTIEMFDSTGWVVYAAVFVAMAFGIANVLLMSVYERFREIGILAAIGMPPARLVVSVVLESLMLTGIGVSLGLALGLGATWALGDGIDLSGFAEGLTAYGIGTKIVPVVRPGDLAAPVAVALVTAVLASLWPALRAVRVRPADAVRHV